MPAGRQATGPENHLTTRFLGPAPAPPDLPGPAPPGPVTMDVPNMGMGGWENGFPWELTHDSRPPDPSGIHPRGARGPAPPPSGPGASGIHGV